MKIAAFALNGTGYFGQAAGRIGGASQQGKDGAGNKGNTMLDNLMKQKENITKNKNDLIARTMENGRGMDSISGQLKDYEDQLKAIDEQISQAALSEQKDKLNPDKKDLGISGIDQKPVSEEEAQNKKVTDMLSLGSNFKQAEQFEALKSRMESRIGILESEIKLDKGRTQSASKSFDKSDAVRELKNSIQDISEGTGAILNKTNVTIQDLNQSAGENIQQPESDKSQIISGAEAEENGTKASDKDSLADVRTRETKVWESKIEEYKDSIYRLSGEKKTNMIETDA